MVGTGLPLVFMPLPLDVDVLMCADTGRPGIHFEIMPAFSSFCSTTISFFAKSFTSCYNWAILVNLYVPAGFFEPADSLLICEV